MSPPLSVKREAGGDLASLEVRHQCSLEELRSSQGLERPRELAGQSEPGVGLTAETVGPAVSYVPLSRRAFGMAAEAGEEPSSAPMAATALEPTRTMTFEECKKGLGSSKAFCEVAVVLQGLDSMSRAARSSCSLMTVGSRRA